MESNERYPGVCILYLSSIDYSCWKFRTLEERKKTRHGREVMKDILASTFSIYRSTHSYWIFRTKEEKEITRRRSGANGIYPGLGISRYSCGLRIISQVSNQAVDIMKSLLTIKRRRILMNRNAAEMKSDRIWKIAAAEKSDERFLHPSLLETPNMRRDIVHTNAVSGRK